MRILFDTSAMYKRYAQEFGHSRVIALSQQANSIVVAAHCKTELASALNRQRHDGVLAASDYAVVLADIHADFADFEQVALDRPVELLAIAAMEQHRLRAMDALHIATAQLAQVDLFVSADRRQTLAAQRVGLNTELIEKS